MLSHGILPGFRNVGRVIENCWNEVEERRTWKSEAECKSITSVRFCGSVFPGGGVYKHIPCSREPAVKLREVEDFLALERSSERRNLICG